MIDGILAVDKPQGCTSHDVVARVRFATGQRQVGHAGTLDPLATGVLVIVLGRATRLASYLVDSTKVYCAEIVLGATTATDDAEAPLQSHAPIGNLTAADIDRCLWRFVGPLEQVPPAYAAVKIGGERMYRLARKGAAPAAPARHVTVYEIRWLDWQPPHLRVRISCSAGTYIRSLARDVGAALGCGGYLHALRRIESGGFRIDEAVPLAELSLERVREALAPADRAVLTWPAAVLDSTRLELVRDGRAVLLEASTTGNLRLYDSFGRLVALARASGDVAQPFRVFARGGANGAGSD
ncbi:MAG TPA: tRNA pseudouridine(55) synthase TruB [Chloroflexota bacterium]|nr:tRNA pseudouridine(55) synthase TruB [Chloroflexota bacterium]